MNNKVNLKVLGAVVAIAQSTMYKMSSGEGTDGILNKPRNTTEAERQGTLFAGTTISKLRQWSNV